MHKNYYAGDSAYNIIKNIPKGIWEDVKTTGDINGISNGIIGNIETLGNKAGNMTQYIRPVLYG